MGRVFRYAECYGDSLEGTTHSVYMRYSYTTRRRNFLLWLVPSMYTIAGGTRSNLGETWGRIQFREDGDYDIDSTIAVGSVRHRKRAMPTMMKYLAPQIYRAAIFNDEILSPFFHTNRYYYRYREKYRTQSEAMITFTPYLRNTQLVRGSALIDIKTGRVIRLRIVGESDNLTFDSSIEMGRDSTTHSILPRSTATKTRFKMLGNHITATLDVAYDSPVRDTAGFAELPDTAKMERLRPDSLDDFERTIYNMYYHQRTATDHVKTKTEKVKDAAWDFVGNHLINSTRTSTENAYVRISPLFNPLYMSWSSRRGLAYKLRINSTLRLGQNSHLSLNPFIGYNFKITKLYYTLPLRYYFDERRDRWLELLFRNGNRMGNSSVLDIIKDEHRDTINFDTLRLDEFNDYELRLTLHWRIGKWLWAEGGAVWHCRPSLNKPVMRLLGKPEVYRSFAPRVQISVQPWPKGPVLSGSYERSIMHIMGSNIKYEKYEQDLSYKKSLIGRRSYALRFGWGQFTNSETNYFLDFENFHYNYLPDGWDDEYSGEFQLLHSRWYNASKYYVRANASYTSPLLIAKWLPYLGRYIENERLYANFAQLEKTRPYLELGYGFTTRFFSIGLFVSSLSGAIYETGTKFTFELFRKW